MIPVVFTFYIAFWLSIASKKQGCCPRVPFLPWLPLRDADDDAPNSSLCARDGVLELMLQALHARTRATGVSLLGPSPLLLYVASDLTTTARNF
jgi:hypothetical protein